MTAEQLFGATPFPEEIDVWRFRLVIFRSGRLWALPLSRFQAKLEMTILPKLGPPHAPHSHAPKGRLERCACC